MPRVPLVSADHSTCNPPLELLRKWASRSMRILMLLLGLAGIMWGGTTFPIFWRYASLERLSLGIVDRYAYSPKALALVLPEVEAAEHDSYCRAEALRGAAIVRLRLAEDTLARGEREAIDGDFANLDRTTRQALACSPADSFLWMTLSWLQGAREGFSEDQLQLLRMSYLLGPNEGWVAVRRNRMALSMFERLTPDLEEAALDEFARMLGSGIFSEAIAIFVGPGWPIRDKLLPRLAHVGQAYRDLFAKMLYERGYDVDVPGTARRDPRPWY
jgi:hypothetical protein